MEFDLTKKICSFLDAHLMLQLVDFLKGYSEEDINKAKADILAQTGCCDYAITVYQTIGRDIAPLQDKKQKLVDQLNQLKTACEVVTQFIEAKKEQQQQQPAAPATQPKEEDAEEATPAPVVPTKSELTFGSLREKVTPEIVESLYKYAKLLFETGQYKNAREYLDIFVKLSHDRQKNFSALWGILEADILSSNWTAAVADIPHLKDEIDSNHGLTPVQQLHQRAWLIHRSLFVYFNQSESRALLVDLLLDDKYLNAVQTICPHVLRYLSVAIITNRRKPQQLYQLVKVIEQEAYTYRDPITLFISSLYVRFNFEESHQYLNQCEQVLKQDFFLSSCYDDFMENARACIFETYCNIHENIDIDMLCKNLGIKPENSEKWIVEAIRNARFVAKIDSANNQIKMFSQHTNAYRQVMDKTKGLFNRGIEILVGINDSRTQQARRNAGDRQKGQRRPKQQNQQNQQQNQQQQPQQQQQQNPQQPNQPTQQKVASPAPVAV